MPDCVNLLEPLRGGRTDDWDNSEEMWERFEAGLQGADLFFFRSSIGVDDIPIEFCYRFRKPIMIDPAASMYSPQIIYSAAKSRDASFEVYAPDTWESAVTTMKALEIKKVVGCTQILIASRFGSAVSKSSVDSFADYDQITGRLGTRFRHINAHELLDCMSEAGPEGNYTTPGRITPNLTEEDLAEVERMADGLIEGAASVDVSRDYLMNSLKAYVTVRKFMDLNDCNGFTVPCPDICSTRRINQMKFTFCLTHSLMMENGIPSACEYDSDSVLSQQVLIAASGRSPYMGNTNPLPFENGRPSVRFFGGSQEEIEELDDCENLYTMQHSVPNRCMNGKPCEYSLQHFAYDQKFGGVIRYDFTKDKGQKITLCRFSPDGKKLLVGSGEIVCGSGYNQANCATVVVFRVKDRKRFWKQQIQVGNHCAMVYGDYTEVLKEFADIVGCKVLEA